MFRELCAALCPENIRYELRLQDGYMREMFNSELKDKESEDSLYQLADKLVGSVAEFVKISKTEEELRIGFEKLLDPILKSLGIESVLEYERLDAEAKKIYRGHPDAVHGQMIIEYQCH